MLEGVFLVLLVGFFFAHAVWVRWCKTQREPRLARARALLANTLNAPVSLGEESKTRDEGLKALLGLPISLRVQILIELARSLGGTQKLAVAELAVRARVVARAEDGLKSRLWWRRLYAARVLTILGAGGDSMPRLLRDPDPGVRAQAGEWAADHPTPGLIEALLALLTDPARLCRFTAQNSLLRMGGLAVPALVGYLSNRTGSAAEAALEVAAGLAEPRFLAPALRLSYDATAHTRALATALLGQLGGPDAVAVLMQRLADSDSSVRTAAARALGRLGHWPAAAALARALRDAAWDVRREAGLALRALGSPGVLLLRRSLSDDDAFACDMARQVLDIPESVAARPVA
jgi:hypothetical protein